jgi:hypothetical protein
MREGADWHFVEDHSWPDFARAFQLIANNKFFVVHCQLFSVDADEAGCRTKKVGASVCSRL